MDGPDAVGHHGDPQRLAVAGDELRLLAGEEGGGRDIGDHGQTGREQPSRSRLEPIGAAGGQELVDRAGQLALVHAAGAALEVGVAEVVGLEHGQEAGCVDVELHLGQPGVQQGQALRGAEAGADAPGAGVALEHQSLGQLHGHARVGGTIRAGARRPAPSQRTGAEHEGAVGPLGGAALLAVRRDAPGADVCQQLGGGGCVRSLGVGTADVHAGVVVGTADGDAAMGFDVDRGRRVQLPRPGPVPGLPDREQLRQHPAMGGRQRSRDVKERVRERTRDLVLMQILRARRHVTAAGLQPVVVGGGDPEAQHVDRLWLTSEPGGQLLRDERVGPVHELERPVNRVVIGDGHEVHPPLLGEFVHLVR